MKSFTIRLMLALLLAVTAASMANAQKPTANEKRIKKENAEYVKYLKRHYDCKVDVRETSDGSWYYQLRKKNKIGVVDQNGRLIVPIEKDHVSYLSSFGEHKLTGSEFLTDYSYQMPAVEPVFVVDDKNGFSIVSLDGDINVSGINELSFLPGFYFFSPGTGIKREGVLLGDRKAGWYNSASGDNVGLMTQDGHIILPASYKKITIGSPDKGPKAGYSVAYIDQVRNDITYTGAKSIDGQLPDVPCVFGSVEVCADLYGRPYWKCQPKTEDYSEAIVFDPSHDYTYLLRCRDKGEKLYLMGNLAEALDYYNGEGASAPWAKFYTGCIKQRKSTTMNLSSKYLTGRILHDRAYTSGDAYSYLDGTYPHPDFDAERKMLNDGANDFLEYLQGDSTFAVAAQRHYQQIVGDGGLLANLETVTIPDYDKAIGVLESKRSSLLQSRYEAQQRALAEERQRLAEEEARRNQPGIFESLLGIALVGVTSAVINSATGSGRSSSAYTPSSSSSSSSSSMSSSSSGNNSQRIAEWEKRKSDAEDRLKKYEDELKKNPNSAYAKENIRTMKDIIKNCDENLARLRK